MPARDYGDLSNLLWKPISTLMNYRDDLFR